MPVVSLEEAYCILGLEVGASEDEVRRSYKKLALRTHPDKNPDDAHAHKKFLQISEAYKRITDPDSFKEEEGGEPSEEEMQAMFNTMFAEMMGFGGRGSGFGGIPMSMFEMFDEMVDDEMDEDEYGNPYGTRLYYDEDDDEDDEDYYFEDDEDGDEDDFHVFMQGGGAGSSMMEAMLMEALMQEQFGMDGDGGLFFGSTGRRVPSQSQGLVGPAAAASKNDRKSKKNFKKDKKNNNMNKKEANNHAVKKSPTINNIRMSLSKHVYDNSDDNNEDKGEGGEECDWETDDFENHHLRKKSAKDVDRLNEVENDEDGVWEDEDDEEDGELDEILMGMSEDELMFMMMTGMMGGPGAGRGRGMGGRDGGGPLEMRDMSMLEMLAGGMGGGGMGFKHHHQKSKSSSSKKIPNNSNRSSSKSASSKSKTKKESGKSTVISEDAEPAIRFAGRVSTSSTAQSATSTMPSSSSPRSTNGTIFSVKVGDNVLVFGRHTGKVAFVGDVHYAQGTFVGVVMDDAKQGKNSGTVRGVEYFSCPSNRGLMVSIQDIKKT